MSMLREARMKRETETVNGFRLRGCEVTRLESFSDAVFGFAVTLLVVSLEVPRSFDQLIETMRGFLAFAACFAILAMIWNHHYKFCRSYGLDDAFVRFLTMILLFIVLLYVYPLKFLFNLFINGGILGLPVGGTGMTRANASTVFIIYGLGFAAVFLALAALHFHAYLRRDELELNELERLDTRWEIYGLLCKAGVGFASTLIALSVAHVEWAGFAYFSIAIIMWIHGSMRGKRRKTLRAQSPLRD